MRAISIRQPLASLTAAGIRDLDLSNRDTKYRGTVLLHASSRRVGRDCGKDMTIDQYGRLRNAQALGLVPYDEELPLSAVIGLAELVDITSEPTDSPWDSGEGNRWLLRDVRLFDQPITDIKGKQGLFEVPEVDEDHLPAHHQPATMWCEYRDGEAFLSMTDEEIDRQLDDWPLALCICSDGLTAPLLDGQQPRPLKFLHLVSPARTIIYNIREVLRSEDTHFGRPLSYLAIELGHRC